MVGINVIQNGNKFDILEISCNKISTFVQKLILKRTEFLLVFKYVKHWVKSIKKRLLKYF